MKIIIRVVKSLEDSGLLLKRVSETIQNEATKKMRNSYYVTRYTRWNLLWNILAGWGTNRAIEGVIRAGYGNKRQDHKNKMHF